MPKHKPSGVKVGDLAVLAGTVGLVDNSDDGRNAFLAWYANDQRAARKALFSRVEARRVAAASTPRTITAAEAQAARSGESTNYPANWTPRGAAASVRAATAAGQRLAVVAPQYPPGWLAAAGQAKRQGGVTVVVADD